MNKGAALLGGAFFYPILHNRIEVPVMRQLKTRPFDRFAKAACLLLLAATRAAADGPDTSLITDYEVPSRKSEVPSQESEVPSQNSEVPSQESVADEILEIRQRLGGSIVSDRRSLREFPSSSVGAAIDVAEATDFPAAVVQFRSRFPESQATLERANSAEKTVKSLRDVAWGLDQSAEKLERSELYKQADALRNLAQQFRLDARASSRK